MYRTPKLSLSSNNYAITHGWYVMWYLFHDAVRYRSLVLSHRIDHGYPIPTAWGPLSCSPFPSHANGWLPMFDADGISCIRNNSANAS